MCGCRRGCFVMIDLFVFLSGLFVPATFIGTKVVFKLVEFVDVLQKFIKVFYVKLLEHFLTLFGLNMINFLEV